VKQKHKETKLSSFALYLQSLTETQSAMLSAFFAEFDAHCALRAQETSMLRADFENALLYYAAAGVPLEVALERLDIHNLGGFYGRPPILWYALDDAAKIYPLSMKHGQMAVFRLSASLREPVVPALLQMALTFTIKRFPSFATTVKKGFFWHYLDTAKRRFVIEPETGYPCRPLKVARSGSQSFRVLYYNNRISVEYFHILTDGTGGVIFLKTLLATYLRLTGVGGDDEAGIPDINETPTGHELANAFLQAEQTDSASGFVDMPAVQMSGTLSRMKPCRVLHLRMDAGKLNAVAKSKQATITAYILAQMFLAGRYATDEMNGTISIQVPVNMRKFYPSDTVRNFSMYCGIRLPIEQITGMEAILGDISQQLRDKASKSAMSEMMCATTRMVNAVRYIPLFIKAPAARLVYGFLGDKIFSNTLSNLGVVQMPEAFTSHIESMDFVLGTALTNRAGCSLITFGNVATLSISKLTADPSFEEKLAELLRADGISIIIEGSGLYEG
jgi:hypothetical protein